MFPFLLAVQSWRDQWGLAAINKVRSLIGTRNILQAACCLRALDDGRVNP